MNFEVFIKNIFRYNRKKLGTILKIIESKYKVPRCLYNLRPQELGSEKLDWIYNLNISS